MSPRLRLSTLPAVIAFALVALPGAAHASPGVRVGSTTRLPRRAQVGGSVTPTKQLHLTVALEPQDPAALETFATAVSTPSSPLYHQYLSVPEFAQRFGATPAQVAAVQSSLRAQGLTVGEASANDLSLPVTTTAAQAEEAFAISLDNVTTPSGRVAYANDLPPAVPARVAPYVQSVIGLDDVTPLEPQDAANPLLRDGLRPQAAGASRPQVVTGGPQPCSSATEKGPSGYTADLFATAYGFSPLYLAGDQGAGQTVAVFEQQPYQPSDIATYQACFGTAAPVTPIDVDGGPGPYKPPTSGGEGDGEAALDIEVVAGLAPKAGILVYQGPPTASAPVDILTAMITQNRAKVLSSSWGACEAATPGPQITAENTLLQEAAAQGQSFFISSGDTGAQQCAQLGQGDKSLAVLDPAGQPFATGVGGTTLYSAPESYYSGSNTMTEGVWNDAPEGGEEHGHGTGGGISKQWAMPAYQAGAPSSLGVVNAKSSGAPCGQGAFCREVPDVAADADLNTGYVTFVDGGWTVIGGTSAAAPLWAAYIGLVNASPTCRGIPVGFVNPALYGIAGSSYLNNFHDVTLPSPFSGAANNDVFEGTGGFPVTANYDMTTGLGSMIGNNLAASLCALASPVFSVGIINPGTHTVTVGKPVNLQIQASDSGSSPLGFGAAGLPAGLAINPTTGLISGTPSTVAISTVTVTAGDRFGNAGSTQFAISVTPKPAPKKPPKATKAKLSGVGKGRPRLAFTVTAGARAPGVGKIAITLPKGLAYARAKRALAKGLSLKSPAGKKLSASATVKQSKLMIKLSRAARAVKVTLVYPAVTATPKEAASVRQKKVKKLTFPVAVTDKSNKTTKIALKLRAK